MRFPGVKCAANECDGNGENPRDTQIVTVKNSMCEAPVNKVHTRIHNVAIALERQQYHGHKEQKETIVKELADV
ncbi:hypothetical protein T265_03013 [Opisthorchis viverrini]|uniref:Uncharacterized protein n=1 Tax=Opisthorchis viverrini TaxID=6198 RepID=A0A074ZX69_OPIVI|nr:hypothetical protein T265_03013 [Opisthorchis viverrini]KER30527.1 hypothetical protein T265_03013 [Opisthorchis viverrini]